MVRGQVLKSREPQRSNLLSNVSFRNMKIPLIISGSGSVELSKAVAEKLGTTLHRGEMQYFANGEIRPILHDSVRHKDVYVIQSGNDGDSAGRTANDLVMETLLLIKTLRRSDAGRINLVLPFFPYSRQDKKDNSRGAISARDIADLYEQAGAHRVITFDLHAAQIQGFFNIPCDNLYTAHLIKEYFDVNHFKEGYEDKYALVAPDEGALKRMREYAGMFGLPLFVLSKERDYRKKNEVEKTALIGDSIGLNGRIAIVIDDMIDTFGTINSAAALLEQHGATGIIVAATHGVLSHPALERINSNPLILEVIVSDSVPQTLHTAACPKLRVFSIVDMVSRAILHLEDGKSLSSLFVH
jgi:ribose-phosphate pyrophosphokinase